MKKYLLILASVTLSLNCLASGVKAGPWVSEARTDRVTILWTSDVPGMAYVELADGTKVWETYAGRRVFHRLHSVRIDGLKPGEVLRYRVGGQELVDDSNARNPQFGDFYEGEWHTVRTFDPKAAECRFSVFRPPSAVFPCSMTSICGRSGTSRSPRRWIPHRRIFCS